MEQKRAKEDSDALFLIQRGHFMVTSVLTGPEYMEDCNAIIFVGLLVHCIDRNLYWLALKRSQFGIYIILHNSV